MPGDRDQNHPIFAQPQPTANPKSFRIKHASDDAAYAQIDALNAAHKLQAVPFDLPRGLPEPILTLQQVLGDNKEAISQINANQQIVFHSGGDCGSTRGPRTETEVTDKMVSDFDEAESKEIPQFNILLGDIVYSFGEVQYYYDQFYEPYRDYRAPILAAAGNHDGMVAPNVKAKSLEGFLRNFCAESFVARAEAGGLSRTAQIQPGVFFTFEAPFVRILVLYSNVLEDPGIIADSTIGDSQLKYLQAALERVKTQNYKGALLMAHHHPIYTGNQSGHGGSQTMGDQIDKICQATGVWPHAVLAGHVHNYQRLTRTRSDGSQIPYVICGNSGHNVQKLVKTGPALRAPQVLQGPTRGSDQIVLENYDDSDYGYLRITATNAQLRIEYHPASDGPTSKTADDFVTVDLKSRKIAHFNAADLGRVALAKADAAAAKKNPYSCASPLNKKKIKGRN